MPYMRRGNLHEPLGKGEMTQDEPLFENPFQMQDLLVFDDTECRQMLCRDRAGFTFTDLAWSLHDAPQPLLWRVWRNVPAHRRQLFLSELRRSLTTDERETAQRRVLDSLFWELTYWKTPALYEELITGEQLHPGIFAQLEPDVSGRVVLDAGAGSGRATFECLCHGARLVYAVDPSRGLLRILQQKVLRQHCVGQVVALEGRFDALPLGNKSVDVALACSSFTAEPEQGGEAGLAELQRVTKRGGKVVLIWPRREDCEWLTAHGFQGVTLNSEQEMSVHFKSLPSALRVARRFYAHNPNVIRSIRQHQRPEVPFSVLGINPPRDYYWLIVK
jgi:ubiquinone/menaquinone biosynthesis C-methylase UbiE